jgi:CubicO group peptidase (beta-lactamase class C family)
LIVDAVAGVADAETGRPVTADTPFFSFSIGKGMASTVVHVLAERAVLDYDLRIASLWPEFGAHGKQATTVRPHQEPAGAHLRHGRAGRRDRDGGGWRLTA